MKRRPLSDNLLRALRVVAADPHHGQTTRSVTASQRMLGFLERRGLLTVTVDGAQLTPAGHEVLRLLAEKGHR
jgi:molecular chaperone GrpE (heat shock protein)